MSKKVTVAKAPTAGHKVAINFTPQAKELTLAFDSVNRMDVLGALENGGAKLWGLTGIGTSPQAALDLSATARGAITNSFGTVSIVEDVVLGRQVLELSSLTSSFVQLRHGATAVVDFQYVIQMGNGAFSINTVHATVTGVNETAAFSMDAEGSVTEDSDVESDGMISAQGGIVIDDDDIGDTHQVLHSNTAAILSGGELTSSQVETLSGGFSATASGWTYSIANSALDFLAAGQTITLTFRLQVKDDSGHAASDTTAAETVVVTITGTNDAPSITGAAISHTVADTTAVDTFVSPSGQLQGDDRDSDDDASTVTFGLSAGTGYSINGAGAAVTSYGSLNVQANGSYAFVPVAAAINALAHGTTQTLTFNVFVEDKHGEKTSSTITINLTGANDSPIHGSAAAQAATAGQAFSYIVPAASDVDGDTLTYSASGLPSGLSFNTATRAITGTPTAAGSYTVTVNVNDGHVTVPQQFTITVAAPAVVVAPPVLVAPPAPVVNAISNDRDFDDPTVITIFQGLTAKSGNMNNSEISDTNDVILGDSGGQTLHGGDGNDHIHSAGGDDTVNGGKHDDTLYGGTGGDTLNGNNGVDTIYGGSGNDTLKGGGDGDTLYGGSGADHLRGDGGADTVWGGTGADIFYFAADDSKAAGRDRIMDFKVDEGDKINLVGLGMDMTKVSMSAFSNGAETGMRVNVDTNGNGVVDDGDLSFDVVGVTILTSSDFIFV
jgi:VCBS repeat-containing protein